MFWGSYFWIYAHFTYCVATFFAGETCSSEGGSLCIFVRGESTRFLFTHESHKCTTGLIDAKSVKMPFFLGNTLEFR